MTLEDKINIERKEAKVEGLVEGKIEVAKKMLETNTISKEKIAEFTSLSINEIEEIANSIK